jgi:hypothetical protein
VRTAAPTRRIRSIAFAAVAVVAALAATACQPTPRAENRTRVVIFVHGWSMFGSGDDCASTFGGLESALKAKGFTGSMVTVGYYDTDKNCDVNLRSWGNVSNSTAWPDLSKAFSTFVYETYTKKGITVDLVGHSMGGLIIRGAVYGSGSGQTGFSAPIDVEDAVTLAAPHNGAAWYSNGCLWGQCSGLKPGSSEITWLQKNGDPQGAKGTEWTVIGSPADDTVPVASALTMNVPSTRKWSLAGIEHSDYMGNATAQAKVADALAKVDL